MKQIQRLLFIAGMGASGLSFASTAEITVTGSIKPGACVPTLSNGGRYDFGTISTSQLKDTQWTRLDSAYQQLSVQCDAPTRFGLRAVDARSDSSVGVSENEYGLGMNGTNKIGHYTLAFLGSSVKINDGDAATRLRTYDGGSSWSVDGGVVSYIKNTRRNAMHTFVPVGSTQPVAIRNMVTDLRVTMHIVPLSELDVGDGIELDGASTIEVRYL
ncbi:DUF1120 domain-containing protein [Pseudomonas sp. NPDC089996]|uniref:DUF1120 domain-containing protein n=1 Tax=Pseudomonas sp. NPDC089996 TaxID=3364474 RepID=UPI00381A53FF